MIVSNWSDPRVPEGHPVSIWQGRHLYGHLAWLNGVVQSSESTCFHSGVSTLISHIDTILIQGPLLHSLTATQAWISNHIHIHHKVWDEITYCFPNFNGAAVEV